MSPSFGYLLVCRLFLRVFQGLAFEHDDVGYASDQTANLH